MLVVLGKHELQVSLLYEKWGQHLPECLAIFQNNQRKTSGLFPGLGGQNDPD
jgi:hypothetical protein